ncbi:DUF3887 domain-containing protein [Mycobacterium sp. RTGN5]|uniref:DUF3887 domain-containing protein n=1 Tax=Mycobacterium sp. RTGN5 TaxID=3016522 RepID=UPI0029C722E4|nr:DUF3887 domain-containing protein [Mycobacterium sp. RTGN5]
MHDESDPLELVRAAREARDRAEASLTAAVQQAREAGRSWQEIGEVMNTNALPEAEELARTVIDDLAHARWADVRARFDATMRDGLTEEGLAEGWAHIAGLAGAYESHGDTDAVRAGDFTTTNTPLSFEAGEFVARISFRDDQSIAGLYILDPDAAGAQAR